MEVPISELLTEAVTLMVVGMTVVFVFLTLLIGAVTFIAFINRKFPEQIPSQHTMHPHRPAQGQIESSSLIAAISAAVHEYRTNRK
ncbi:OadG family transporter subunit [Aliiglaciecola sp. LCG003]|uniref:OadG family protein n=1 Tax=Aliiglaciecola sp. LCG003 TaxID=3053655 RepID=UPI002572A088|nr:OadG family transporter subunit [Aliiglaciecola sp. LCG003]WJG08378.1 OadG family transporter subunit [Aliiglaciecola sp. LCG003]